MRQDLYGAHPIYGEGGDLGAEQDIIYMAFRRRVGKDRVHGAGTRALFVKGLTVDEVKQVLIDLAYRFVRAVGRGALLSNRIANVVVLPREAGISIELEEPAAE